MESVRNMSDKILIKALADKEFRAKLTESPREVLEAEGIKPELAEDLAREIKIDGRGLTSSCSWTCSWTCNWSVWR